MKVDFAPVKAAIVRHWPKHLGRLRTSTVVLVILFVALSWVQQTYAPAPTPEPAATQPAQVVPPGLVPDPQWTWVPRTQVRTTTPTTTEPETTVPETTTASPTTTTEPTTPTDTPTTTPTAPRTTVFDPDGPGPLPAITLPLLPGQAPGPTGPPQETGQGPVAPTLPR